MERFDRILFCTDFGPSALAAFPYAIRAAQRNGGRLVILHVLPDADAQFWRGYVVEDGKDLEAKSRSALHARMAADYLSKIPAGIECETIYRAGKPAEKIVEAASQGAATLIVMGRRKPAGLFGRLTGNGVAMRVAEKTKCPLLVIPS